jgi:hypothetical protein
MIRRSLPLLPLVLLACGSPPPGPTTPPPPVPTAPVVTEPPVDVSPIPEPPNLIVVARLGKPDALLKTVGGWTHLPIPSARDLVKDAVGDAMADIVDPSQPVDAAVTIALSRHGVDPNAAVSIGIKNFDDAKAKLAADHKLDPATNGSFKVHGLFDHGRRRHGRGEQQADDDDEENLCVLAHAQSGAKLVCGEPDAVDQLTPYMSRTMPRSSWPADIHIEVRPEPVRGPLADMRAALPMMARAAMGSQSPGLKDLVDASIGEGLDIVDDAQKLTFDATINDSGVNVQSRFEFQGNKSVVARALTDASRADQAPPAFWHLPGDTDTAVFMRGSDPKLYDHAREILTNLLTEGMDQAQLPDSEKKAVHDLVADKMLRLFTNGGTGIYAKGFDQAALEKAVKARNAIGWDDWGKRQDAKRAVGEQVVGWHLYQVSDPIAKTGPILKDWSSLWNRPAFAKWFETKTDTKAKEMPRFRITPPPAGVTLPRDTVHLEVTVPMDPEPMAFPAPPPPPPLRPGGKAPPPPPAKPAPKKPSTPPKPVVVHIFAVPDGANTWLAFGCDGKLVASKVAAALSSAPDANTLGKTAQGVELLKDPKINGGGLITLRGLMVITALDGDDKSPFMAINNLPGKGMNPILLSGKAEAASSAAKGGASVGQLNVSRAVIEDIVKLFLAMK